MKQAVAGEARRAVAAEAIATALVEEVAKMASELRQAKTAEVGPKRVEVASAQACPKESGFTQSETPAEAAAVQACKNGLAAARAAVSDWQLMVRGWKGMRLKDWTLMTGKIRKR